jgi:hypothetical protein
VEKTGLTKREKMLLMIMVVGGLAVVMVMYVIMPQYNRLIDQNTLRDNLLMERMRVEMVLATEASLREGHAEAQDEYELLRMLYLEESHLSMVGRLLTDLCNTHWLEPIEQRLSPMAAFTETGTRADDAVFSIVTAIMTVNGTYGNLKNMLDTVEKTEFIRVTRIYLSRREGIFDNTVQDRMTIHFEVAMMRDM